MRLLFVMDPVETMIPDKDTSFALMRGAAARGHECLHCLPREVSNRGRRVFARARSIVVSDAPPHTGIGADGVVDLDAVDAVLVRKDPPFDAAYAHLTHQLDLVKDRTLVVNDPRALRDANEKLYTFQFEEFMPRSLVSADPELLLAFASEVGGEAVLKPLDGAGGSGVVVISVGSRNARAIADLLTDEGRRLALAQEYEPAVLKGDKRVLLLDGEPLGAILRIPRKDDFRANIHVGGRVEAARLDDDEDKMVRSVGARLKEAGLWLVGLDLIGGKLIEINVTSPTGIQQLGRLTGTRPELEVVEWLERRAASRRTGARSKT